MARLHVDGAVLHREQRLHGIGIGRRVVDDVRGDGATRRDATDPSPDIEVAAQDAAAGRHGQISAAGDVQRVAAVEIGGGRQRDRQVPNISSGAHGDVAADTHDALIEAAEVDIPGHARVGGIGQQPWQPELSQEGAGIVADAGGRRRPGRSVCEGIGHLLDADDVALHGQDDVAGAVGIDLRRDDSAHARARGVTSDGSERARAQGDARRIAASRRLHRRAGRVNDTGRDRIEQREIACCRDVDRTIAGADRRWCDDLGAGCIELHQGGVAVDEDVARAGKSARAARGEVAAFAIASGLALLVSAPATIRYEALSPPISVANCTGSGTAAVPMFDGVLMVGGGGGGGGGGGAAMRFGAAGA